MGEQKRARANSGRRKRSLGAGVSAADNNHIKGVGELHGVGA